MTRALVFLLVFAGSLSAACQTTSVTSASGGLVINGAPVNGTLTISSQVPIAVSGGGLHLPSTSASYVAQCKVSAGAITGSCSVPSSTLSNGGNGVLYSVLLTDAYAGKAQLLSNVSISGTSWALDQYVPPSTVVTPGFTYTTGSGAPSGSCSASSLYGDTSGSTLSFYGCKAGAWTSIGGGTGGSMTWPNGGDAIPHYNGASGWGTSYSASNKIPASLISTLNQDTTGNAATATTATSTSGNAATATNLDHAPTPCTGSLLAGGIDAHGNSINCASASAAVAFASQYSFPGAVILGDSIECGEGSASFSGSTGITDVGSNGVPNGGWSWLVGKQLGPVSTIQNLCQGGATLSDIIAGHMATGTNPQYAQQPTAFAGAGINDFVRFGVGANAIANYTAQVNAVTAWMTTPATAKVMASTCTQTGSGISANTLGNILGIRMTSSGATASCTIMTTGGPLAVVYRVIDANSTGTATLSIDGVSKGTLTSSGVGGQAITGESQTQTEFAQTYTVAAGSHTVLITSTVSGGGVFGFDYIATTYTGPAVVGEPRLMWVGIPHWPADDTDTGTYDSTLSSDVATLAAQGWPVVYANVRAEMNNAGDVSASSTTCRDGSTTTGSTETNHPNDCGYMAMRDVVLKTVAANPVSYYQGAAASTQAGFINTDPTYITTNTTYTPGVYDLVYVTANAAITLTTPTSSTTGGPQQRIRFRNYGSNAVTIAGPSSAHNLQTSGSTTYCASGCSSTGYTVAANHTVDISSTGGVWIVVSDN